MASLRPGRPTCIRAAFSSTGPGASFRKRQRNARRRLQVPLPSPLGHGGRFLDSYDGDSEDCPGHFGSCPGCFLGERNNVPLYTPKSRSPEDAGLEDFLSSKAPHLAVKAASWAPTPLEANDVDMQSEGEARLPLEPGGPQEAGKQAEGPQASQEDPRTTRAPNPGNPMELLEPGRHLPSRAKGTRMPPRLGGERDKGPKLSLSKRKLELLLAEPEKNKRKKQFVA
ncbi:hypothetical protein SUZIE_103080 [Sciurus carolinensis]|uniref:Uncharacterized protein n=1 Tax=Sciurus carolinensis TaxID=30640 RepID=A0AA41MCS9_SCICA|nr:hypothetical protein [Sciurus carolinensis]